MRGEPNAKIVYSTSADCGFHSCDPSADRSGRAGLLEVKKGRWFFHHHPFFFKY